jgi:hypothetical protein
MRAKRKKKRAKVKTLRTQGGGARAGGGVTLGGREPCLTVVVALVLDVMLTAGMVVVMAVATVVVAAAAVVVMTGPDKTDATNAPTIDKRNNMVTCEGGRGMGEGSVQQWEWLAGGLQRWLGQSQVGRVGCSS